MNVDHGDIVQQLHVEHPPERTVNGAIHFLLRLLAKLPASERAGLLIKTAGENIGGYIQDGVEYSISAGRICYPDGQLYKVLTDVPTTNGPGWHDDGTVDPARYLAVQANPPPPPPPPPPDDGIAAKLDVLIDLQRQHHQAMMGLAGVVAALAEKPAPEYTAPIPALPWPISMPAGELVLKPRT